MNAGKIIKHAESKPFDPAEYLSLDDLQPFLEDALKDGDARAILPAMRVAARVLGMTELARRTGLSRETLYRTLGDRGNPRLDTLATLLQAFGLRLSVQSRELAA